jgi:hypothetical protein
LVYVIITAVEDDVAEAKIAKVQQWFAELDRFGPEFFLAEGRDQPATPTRPPVLSHPLAERGK